jgi:hypothetical protein
MSEERSSDECGSFMWRPPPPPNQNNVYGHCRDQLRFHTPQPSLAPRTTLLLLSFCGAGGIPPSALQPFEAYCANPAFSSPFISRGAPRHTVRETSISERRIIGKKWQVKFSLTMRLPRHCRVLLHVAKLRHGTDGFTSPPKEGMLRIFLS